MIYNYTMNTQPDDSFGVNILSFESVKAYSDNTVTMYIRNLGNQDAAIDSVYINENRFQVNKVLTASQCTCVEIDTSGSLSLGELETINIKIAGFGVQQECTTNIIQGGSSPVETIEVTYVVSQSRDDAEERLSTGTVYLWSTDLELCMEAAFEQAVGMRFSDIAIPKDSTIISATLTFTVDEKVDDEAVLTIKTHAIDDSTRFSSDDNDISNRETSTSSVTWEDIPSPEVGEELVSPDISVIIQEIIERDGWKEANSITVIMTGTGHRIVESWDGDDENAAELYIEYIPP